MFLPGSKARSEKGNFGDEFKRVLFECSSFLFAGLFLWWIYARKIVRRTKERKLNSLPRWWCGLWYPLWRIRGGKNVLCIKLDIATSLIDVFCPTFVCDSQIMTAFPCMMDLPATQPRVKTQLDNQGNRVLTWPGRPDLNPIECLWKDMKDEISQVECINKIELSERLIKVWHKKTARRYIRGMQAVV